MRSRGRSLAVRPGTASYLPDQPTLDKALGEGQYVCRHGVARRVNAPRDVLDDLTHRLTSANTVPDELPYTVESEAQISPEIQEQDFALEGLDNESLESLEPVCLGKRRHVSALERVRALKHLSHPRDLRW